MYNIHTCTCLHKCLFLNRTTSIFSCQILKICYIFHISSLESKYFIYFIYDFGFTIKKKSLSFETNTKNPILFSFTNNKAIKYSIIIHGMFSNEKSPIKHKLLLYFFRNRASWFIKKKKKNYPVTRINIFCTLLFRFPVYGKFLKYTNNKQYESDDSENYVVCIAIEKPIFNIGTAQRNVLRQYKLFHILYYAMRNVMNPGQ